jgi:hypothetical protein
LWFVLVLAATAAAQNECYDDLYQIGKTAYDAADYPKALLKWRAALQYCPDLTRAQQQTLRDWIQKAENPSRPSGAVAADLVLIPGGTCRMGNVLGYGNGAGTGMMQNFTGKARGREIHRALPAENIGLRGAVRGTAIQWTVARLVATTGIRTTGSTPWAFGWRGICSPLPLLHSYPFILFTFFGAAEIFFGG